METRNQCVHYCPPVAGKLPSLSLTHLADNVVDGVGEEEVAGRIKRDAKGLADACADGRPIIPHGLPMV